MCDVGVGCSEGSELDREGKVDDIEERCGERCGADEIDGVREFLEDGEGGVEA